MLEFCPEVAALDFSESVGSIINTNGSDATGLGSVEDNLVLWLDAKNINGQNNDGISNAADVSTWVDLSGGGNDVTGYSSYDVPVYQASGFNGLPSVYFDANDILHAADTGLDDPFRMDRMTIFIVGNNNINESSNIWRGSFISKYGEITGSGNYAGWKIRRWGSSTKLAFTMEGNLGSASILDEVDGIFTARFDGVNKELWANGLLDASTAHSRDKVDYSNNNSPLAVGGYFSSATNVDGYMKGDISEILVFNRALTPAEQQGVNYYLSTKWGLGSVVDSDADGFTDAAEVVAGTSPTDASSNLIPDLSVDMTGKPAILAEAKLWLDASNVDGYNNISLSDGDAVSTWTDLSGNGNDAAPKGSANQPTYKGDKVYFDGSNDYLRIPISANDELDVSNKSFTAFNLQTISNSNTTVL